MNEPNAILNAIAFNQAGLVPAIAQQHDTGEVLMLAWMSPDSIAETLADRGRCATSPAPATPSGAKAKPPATPRNWWSCGSTATATRCCCWSTKPAPALPHRRPLLLLPRRAGGSVKRSVGKGLRRAGGREAPDPWTGLAT